VLDRVLARSVYRFAHDGLAISSWAATNSSTAGGTSSGSSRNSPTYRTVTSCSASPSFMCGPRRRPISFRSSSSRKKTLSSSADDGTPVYRPYAAASCGVDGVMDPSAEHLVLDPYPEIFLRNASKKEVAIPIRAVTKIGTVLIHLSLTKHQVKDLPRGPSSTRVLWIAPDSALVADDNLYFTCEDCRRYLKYDTFFNRLARDNLGWSIVKACALRYGLDRVCCIRLAVRTGDRRGILERPKRANRLCSGIRDLEFCGKIAIATFKEIIIASRRIDYSS
jgi:hypothetical protein